MNKAATAPNTEIKAKMGRYIFRLPRQLQDEFLAVCKYQGLHGAHVLIKFMNKYVSGKEEILEILEDRCSIAEYVKDKPKRKVKG